jgi:FkbM family methyltransferase
MKKAGIKKTLLKKVARLLIKLRISSIFQIRQKGFVLRFYPSSVSRVLWVDQYLSGECYQEERMFLTRYLRHSDVVIDVGANIGLLTLLSSVLVGKQGKVYSIEPHPRVCRFLRGNLDLNSVENVRTFNYALGNKSGTVRFSDRKGDDKNSVVWTDPGIIVDQKRLDELSIEDEQITLLKIDVEGYEKFVIEGAARLLKNVQCIYFEAIERHFLKFGYRLEDLLNVLRSHHFEIFEVSADEVCRIHPSCYPKFSTNLVAVRDVNAFSKRTKFSVEN